MPTSSVDFAAEFQGMLIALFDTDNKKLFVSERSTGGWISDSCSYSSEFESGSIPFFSFFFSLGRSSAALIVKRWVKSLYYNSSKDFGFSDSSH